MARAFADDNNVVVSSTVTGAWTNVGSNPWSGPFDFQAVYWDGSATQVLQIRDRYGRVIYDAVSDGDAVIDQLPSPLTVDGPLQYYTDQADKTIIVFGKVE